jgi:hypothetical protein
MKIKNRAVQALGRLGGKTKSKAKSKAAKENGKLVFDGKSQLNKGEKENMNKNSLVGKLVIVRSNVAGVHAGRVSAFYPSKQTVTLTGAYRLWRFYTRDKSGSVSDIAANGLKPNGGHSIGAKLASVTIVNPGGLELAEMSEEAYASVEAWKN